LHRKDAKAISDKDPATDFDLGAVKRLQTGSKSRILRGANSTLLRECGSIHEGVSKARPPHRWEILRRVFLAKPTEVQSLEGLGRKTVRTLRALHFGGTRSYLLDSTADRRAYCSAPGYHPAISGSQISSGPCAG